MSFLLAGISSIFNGLCFAELATRLPVSGSAYLYVYCMFGELPALMPAGRKSPELPSMAHCLLWNPPVALESPGFGKRYWLTSSSARAQSPCMLHSTKQHLSNAIFESHFPSLLWVFPSREFSPLVR